MVGLVPLGLSFGAGFIGLSGLTAAGKTQLERGHAIVGGLVERLLDSFLGLARGRWCSAMTLLLHPGSVLLHQKLARGTWH